MTFIQARMSDRMEDPRAVLRAGHTRELSVAHTLLLLRKRCSACAGSAAQYSAHILLRGTTDITTATSCLQVHLACDNAAVIIVAPQQPACVQE